MEKGHQFPPLFYHAPFVCSATLTFNGREYYAAAFVDILPTPIHGAAKAPHDDATLPLSFDYRAGHRISRLSQGDDARARRR